MDPVSYLIIIVLCIMFSAFFSGSETALMRLRKEHLDKDIEEAKGPSALAVRDLLHSTSRLLITILLGNNVVNIVGTACASAVAVYFLGQKEGILVASLVMTVTVLLFAEILPKAVAARNAKRISYIVSMPLYVFHQLLWPIHFIFDKLIEPLIRKIARGPGDEDFNEVDEILAMAKTAQEPKRRGSPIAIISGAAEANELTASDIMIPRTEIVAFPVETDADELLNNILAERYTRIPIYKDSLDDILGFIHLKELIKLVRAGKKDLRSIINPVIQVPERKPILDLLANMQRALVHMAIVKDEFGVTEGLVTQEDILEEIVGEIRDEFDREELLTIQPIPTGGYEVLARVRVTDFNKQTGCQVEAERGDTLSGLVFNTLGRAPRQGDEIEISGYCISVLDVSGTRVTRVRVQEMPDKDTESASGD